MQANVQCQTMAYITRCPTYGVHEEMSEI